MTFDQLICIILGKYDRWALIRTWALNRTNTVIIIMSNNTHPNALLVFAGNCVTYAVAAKFRQMNI